MVVILHVWTGDNDKCKFFSSLENFPENIGFSEVDKKTEFA